jgi:hypothetical protein
MDQGQRIGESISDTLRLEQTNISTINTLLNYNNNTLASAPATIQDSLQGSENGHIKPVSGIANIENFRF